MFKIIKNFNWIILSSFTCIFLGILTFLTFINEGFLPLTEKNILVLLFLDILLLLIFFYLIFRNFLRFYSAGKKNKSGSQTNFKYVSLFSIFTLIPSLIVAIFSLVIFNFGLQKYFDDQISQAVNNSNDVARNYLEESKKNVKSDVLLMSVGLNRASNFYYSNPKQFLRVVGAEKILRKIDDIYLIDSAGNILLSETGVSSDNFLLPGEETFDEALKGIPVIIPGNFENKTSAMIKLNSFIDTFLYISRNIDSDILRYLQETEKAVDFYYSVETSQTGIKITFAIIYIIVVTLLLFLSTAVAITFARRLTKPIVNLISASENISKGELDAKVPNIEADDEFKKLNANFNNMITRLKRQQDKLLVTERYEAWELVARKLAHEIKNPLTPIQLSIDRLKEKYSSKIGEDKNQFHDYLQTINRQIKDIEKLVNEFSNFARMPRPVIKKIDLNKVITRSINFLKISIKSNLSFYQNEKHNFIKGDEDQLYRVFINIIKNADESIIEILNKKPDYEGKIDIDIFHNNDYIVTAIKDNGEGILDTKKVMTPYFTTKKNGTGLGLPIVNKIINEHSGEFVIKKDKGTTIEIWLPSI
ncbi:MAG: hypothetical protein CBC16_01900 [Verrucomicrobia bacterium TMED56]|nr:MAG: hypothetical protein CBC16_01900 [Verrucomicrobia bacterium TMED56]